MLIILFQSMKLTNEVAHLYGLKPSRISTFCILKKGVIAIFFSGTSELAIEYVNSITELSIASKISLSAAQGISNGVLLARVGYGTE